MIRKTTDSTHPHARRGLIQRVFALAYKNVDTYPDFYENVVGDYKRWLFGGLSGTVIEIGAGTGANFTYYPAGIHWIGIEPNEFMHDALLKSAEKHGIAGELRTGVAEHMEVPDESADVVISTLVMCSVGDQDATMQEIRRVLKPGGKFLFVEHVAAPENSALRTVQKIIKPFWRVAGDGCHTDRETADAVQRAGFSSVEIKMFRAPIPIVSPHIAGKAVK